jgi:hypothetical protein
MNIIITIDLHTCGTGFQIVVEIGGVRKEYPEPIEDIKEALNKASYLKAAIKRETGQAILDKDVRVTQRAIEYNAGRTPDNMKVYGSMMNGAIKPQG